MGCSPNWLFGVQILGLGRQLAEVTQQHVVVSRLYQAESAVAAQCAEMVERGHASISHLEQRLAEASASQAAAEESRDLMEQQLRQAQVIAAARRLKKQVSLVASKEHAAFRLQGKTILLITSRACIYSRFGAHWVQLSRTEMICDGSCAQHRPIKLADMQHCAVRVPAQTLA